MLELGQITGGEVWVWTGANSPKWSEWNDFIFNNNTMDLVPMGYGWGPGQPHILNDACVKIWNFGLLFDFACGQHDAAPICQAL